MGFGDWIFLAIIVFASALGLFVAFSRKVARLMAQQSTDAADRGRSSGAEGANQQNLSRLETILKERDKVLLDAQRIARIGNWLWDIQSGALEWSDEIYRIFGQSPQSFKATYQAFLDVIHPNDRELVTAAVDGALQGSPYSVQHRIVLPSGEVRIVHERGEVTFTKLGEPLVMHGTVHDVTEYVRLQDTVLRQEKQLSMAAKLSALGELAAGVAHEINNPLAIIEARLAQLRILQKKAASDEEIEHCLTNIERTISRITTIIRGLQHYSNSGEVVGMERVPFLPLVNDAVKLSRERFANSNGVALSYAAEGVDSDLEVDCRSSQITQALMSLLSNAFDGVEKQAEKWVRVRVWRSSDKIMVSVSDSGPGISPEVRERIFDPFFTTKEVGSGTGLGLSLTRGIIEAHHGRVELQEGLPTTFILSLPIQQTHLASE